MGTREVYEEKLRSGNLYHEPTINPGLGSARCPRCLSQITTSAEKGEWTITSVLHDATAVAGSGVGGMLGAVHGFNRGSPFIQKHVKGRLPLQLFVGGVVYEAKRTSSCQTGSCQLDANFGNLLPPLLLFSGACAAFGGFVVPKFAQLSVTSYYAASSASHYAISQATRYIEDRYAPHDVAKKSG